LNPLGFPSRETVLPTNAELRELPAHIQSVERVDLSSLVAAASEKGDHYTLRLLDWLTDASLYDALPVPPLEPTGPPAAITLTDLSLLKEHNFIAKVSQDDVKGWMKVFSVVERAKARRRIICWSKTLNEVLKSQGYSGASMKLGSPASHAARVHEGKFGATMDLKLAYWQLPLSEDVSRFFCFIGPDGEIYRFLVLPMGFVPAAEIQQAVTSLICAPSEVSPSHVGKPDVYLDGIRIVGDKPEDLDAFIDATLERAASFRATFGEIVRPTESYKWLGVMYDHNTRTVRCTDKTLSKIAALSATIAHWSLRDALRAASLLRFASATLRAPLAQYYWALKFLARAASRDDLDAPVNVWPCALPAFQHWFAFVATNHPVTPLADCPSPNAVLFTDATPSRWGAVLILGNVFYIAGSAFVARPSSINVAETEAVAFAWAWAGPILVGKDVALFIDNTSAKAAVDIGFSRVSPVNLAALSVRQVLDLFPPRSLAVRRVSSAANLADGPSRGYFRAAPELVCGLMQAVGYSVARRTPLSVA
jgi:hypothetical protein